MQIRAPEAPREAQPLRHPPLRSGAPTSQVPSRGEGRLAYCASWDRVLRSRVWGNRLTFDPRIGDPVGVPTR
eukprot:7251620-Alexandrium_andersonii.AAC.1